MWTGRLWLLIQSEDSTWFWYTVEKAAVWWKTQRWRWWCMFQKGGTKEEDTVSSSWCMHVPFGQTRKKTRLCLRHFMLKSCFFSQDAPRRLLVTTRHCAKNNNNNNASSRQSVGWTTTIKHYFTFLILFFFSLYLCTRAQQVSTLSQGQKEYSSKLMLDLRMWSTPTRSRSLFCLQHWL